MQRWLVVTTLVLATQASLSAQEETAGQVRQDFSKLLNKARAAKSEPAESELVEIVDRYWRIIDEQSGTTEEIAALREVLNLGVMFDLEKMRENWTEAMDLLVKNHVDNPQIVDILAQLPVPKKLNTQGAEYLKQIEAETKNKAIKAAILFSKAQPLLNKDESTLTDADRKLVLQTLDQLIKDYGKEQAPFGQGLYEEVAANARFALENLRVGAMAPDIEGKDLDGNPFKLSDYRGRVVLLDFWGHW